MCLGNKDDEQVAVRHADASGGYIIENQHEEDRSRGSKSTKENQKQQTENKRTNGGRQCDLNPYVVLVHIL